MLKPYCRHFVMPKLKILFVLKFRKLLNLVPMVFNITALQLCILIITFLS
jgi:hypothetical protein